MILAQIREIGDAAQRQLDRAADFGFASYVLMFVFVLGAAAAAIHFFYIVKPDTEARRESAKSRDDCMATFANNYTVQTRLLEEIDAHLSDIGRQVGLNKERLREMESRE